MRPITGICLIVAAVFFVGHYIGRTRPLFQATTTFKDYQIELDMDTVEIWDKSRLVGRFTNTTWNSQYDSIIMKDNE